MMVQVIGRTRPVDGSFHELVVHKMRWSMGAVAAEVLAARVVFHGADPAPYGFVQECHIEVQTRQGAFIAASVTDMTREYALDRALRRITRRVRNHLRLAGAQGPRTGRASASAAA